MPRILLLNHVVLFLCCSMYLGTGGSLVLFQFPLEPMLTIDNYYLIFIEPVTRATTFFTYMTVVMLVTASVMLVTEWFSGIRWVPVIVILGVVAATTLTLLVIIPLNRELGDHIRDPERLRVVFHEWANMNRIRVALWVIQWSAMMYYFYKLALRAREDR